MTAAKWLITALALGALPRVSAGQRLEIGISAGGLVQVATPGPFLVSGPGEGSLEGRMDVDPALLAVPHVAFLVSSKVAGEGRLYLARGTITGAVTNVAEPPIASVYETTSRSTFLAASARLCLSPFGRRLGPYIAAGPAVLDFTDSDSLLFQPRLAGGVGVGARWRISRVLSLRTELEALITRSASRIAADQFRTPTPRHGWFALLLPVLGLTLELP
jgi:hypothetical protein